MRLSPCSVDHEAASVQRPAMRRMPAGLSGHYDAELCLAANVQAP